MSEVVEIKLGEYRGIHWFDANNVACKRGDMVIVDVNRSVEFGEVASDIGKVCKPKNENLAGKLLRLATDGDLKQIEMNRLKAKDSISACERKINERKLDMRLVKAEYAFDTSKVVFFFTSEGRVDFRNLVQDLAKVFRMRIELKQIGVRDKAKIVGGYGVCGRELCCSSYMKNFHALSIKMSKEQGLPLNPTRISGVCGRIKCCMAYEYSVYREFAKALPRLGDKVNTPEGKGKVIEINYLRQIVSVDLGEGRISRVPYATINEN